MTHIENVAMTAQMTFGRDGAMFEGLLGFVAQLSMVLWGLVILTTIIRFVGIWLYRRGAARAALAAAGAPAGAYVQVRRRALWNRRANRRSGTHVPVLAANSPEA
jgi:hypothetical protein